MTGKSASLAKITGPKVKGILLRKRLFRRLDICRQLPVTWVSGPAGCGKTSLVASYLDQRKIPHLWYQVDEGDSDLATFFHYMGQAAKTASPRRQTPLPLLTPEYLAGVSTFTLRYFEELYRRLRIPTVLVFDNCHRVPAESPFHEIVLAGVSSIPEGINLILISRSEPPPKLVQLQANRMMEVLGWDELRLTAGESAATVRLRAPKLKPGQWIRQLHSITDGWVAGLVLMLESMKRGVEPHSPGKMTSEEIIDYFGNEIFNKRDGETQDFFLKTSFLPKMTAGMAETLTAIPHAYRILSTLSRNNYFTEKHYSIEPVYQYHPLLREFLMARAKETFSHETLSTLLHRAGVLLEKAGQTEDAISLFRDLGDWGAMVRMIMRQAPSMIEQGRYRPLEEWLDSLPEEILKNDPWLLYWKGTCRSPFDPSLAQPYFEQAFEQFRAHGNLPGLLLAWSGVVYSIIYRFEEYLPLDRWIQLFPELPENPEKIIPPEVWIHAVSSMFTALTYRRLGHSETNAWIRRAKSMVQGTGSAVVKAQILLQLVHYYGVIGDYEQSLLGVRSLQHLAQSKEGVPFVVIMTRLAEAMHYGLTGDDDKCLKAVSEGLKTSENTGIFLLDYVLLAHGVANCQNVGNLGLAQAMLEKIVSSWNHLRPFDKGLYHLVQARQFLLRSELGAASVQAELALETNLNVGAYDPICLTHLLAAQVMHRTGKHRDALGHLHEASLIAERLKSKIFEYYGLMVEAHFYFEGGDEASGLASLRKALVIGKDWGLLNTFIDQPDVTARLCIRALEEGIEVPYVQDLIRKRRLIPEKPPLHLETWPWTLKVYTLGKFELFKEGQPVEFQKKVQKKPLLMLKAMIALGGKDIDEEQLSDILWPEADGDQAYSAFTTTLSRLRQLMGEKVIEVRTRRVTLDPRHCWVDVWAFEHLIDKAEIVWKEGRSADHRAEVLKLMGKAIDIYRGHFLADEESEPFWVLPLRERLKDRFLVLIEKLGHSLEQAGQWEKAIAQYQKALEVDNLAEEFYRRLMVCYENLGETVKAVQVYRRLKSVLSSVLEIPPSPKTEAIYRTLTERVKVYK
jgi:LuxR family maltose regulon positive regulatory protein